MNESLIKYLNEKILPQYDSYDKGHNRGHIWEVVAGVLELSAEFDVNVEMLYTAAIFHDLGLCEGRETHHLASARMLGKDTFLCDYFSPEQMRIMAEAVEDHRASAKHKPRSIYGEILSSADRIIKIDTIIMRSFYHSERHNPNDTISQHIERILAHIKDKYGEGGYLQMPIITKRNKENLSLLRDMLTNEDRFIAYCTELIPSNIAK